MKNLRPACLLVLLLALMANAAAAPLAISNAAYAGVFVRDCRTPAERQANIQTPSKCIGGNQASFNNTFVDSRFDANFGGLTASTTTLSPLATGSFGAVDAAGTPGSLILHQATMTTTSYARASSQVEAMQSFTWDGSGPSHRAIAGHLDFSASYLGTPGAFDAALTTAASFIQASINVFSVGASSFEVETANTGTQFFADQAALLPGFASAASSFFESSTGNSVDWTLEFDLVSGQTYYVDAWFGIWAKFGAGIDASHTFSATLGELNADGHFQQSVAGLQLAAPSDNGVHDGNTIPEPSASALLLLALACVGGLRRHQQRG